VDFQDVAKHIALNSIIEEIIEIWFVEISGVIYWYWDR
jgi:hypothetical protein